MGNLRRLAALCLAITCAIWIGSMLSDALIARSGSPDALVSWGVGYSVCLSVLGCISVRILTSFHVNTRLAVLCSDLLGAFSSFQLSISFCTCGPRRLGLSRWHLAMTYDTHNCRGYLVFLFSWNRRIAIMLCVTVICTSISHVCE